MTTSTRTMTDPGFVNWSKAGLVLQFGKEGVEDLVSTVTNTFHQTILTSLPGGITCTACKTENVLPCPTRGICVNRSTCRYHSIIRPTNCEICEHFRKEVLYNHKSRMPSWHNTDATQWSTNPWELAKCFMPQGGYSRVTSAKDTDLNGMLAVIINHKGFQTVVAEDLSSHTNIFLEVRRLRTAISHNSAKMLTDQELQDCIDTVKRMLSDPGYLAKNEAAQQAIININEIHHRHEKELVYISGNLSYFPGKLLGTGSHGHVYEGRFGELDPRIVAVKVVTCLNEEDAKETHTEIKELYKDIKKQRERKTMETLNVSFKSSNIIEFVDSFFIENIIYIAFEKAIGTLHNYVDDSNIRKGLPCSNVILGIMDGLKFTHQKEIVHRDLKPANIFIVEISENVYKAVIGDYGSAKPTTASMYTLTGNMGSMGYTAPEIWKAITAKDAAESSVGSKCRNHSDIFSMGLVIYFALSLGKHPYGNHVYTAQIEIGKGSEPNFSHISSHTNSVAYIHMLRTMLNDNPAERPKIEVVSQHPALLTSEKVMEFFVNKSDEFENQIKNEIKSNPLKENLLEDPSLVTNKDWMNQLPVHLQTYLRSYTLKNRKQPLYKDKETNIRCLLRVVRNTKAHHTEYPTDAQTELGKFPDGHVALWLNVCPKLLMHVYDKLGPP